jgi:AcrR family transcriptional regulator
MRGVCDIGERDKKVDQLTNCKVAHYMQVLSSQYAISIRRFQSEQSRRANRSTALPTVAMMNARRLAPDYAECIGIVAPRPRKLPRQSRAAHTIEAVLEAAVQIITANGPRALTTTRVAKRSGFAVGTIYQYFANKNELMGAMVRRHVDHVVCFLEIACRDAHGGHPEEMVDALANAFIAANAGHTREVRAIHAVWEQIGRTALLYEGFARLHQAMLDMISGVDEMHAARQEATSHALASILIGMLHALFERGMDEALMIVMREQLMRVPIDETGDRLVDRSANYSTPYAANAVT